MCTCAAGTVTPLKAKSRVAQASCATTQLKPWSNAALTVASTDRKSVVLGKSVDIGGRRLI